MKIFNLPASFICVSALVFQLLVAHVPSANGAAQEPAVTQALIKLQSPNPFERESARRQLLSTGSAAIDPLMALLSEQLDGLTAEASPLEDSQKKSQLKASNSYRPKEEANWMLIADYCSLLGQLRAARAVPLLIKVIEVHEIYSLLPKRTAEADALILIGPAAEPDLLKALSDAYDRAGQLVGQGPYRLQVQEEKAREVRIQIAAVLSTIGDAGTVAALEDLLKSPEFADGPGKSIAESTIFQIKNRWDYRPTR